MKRRADAAAPMMLLLVCAWSWLQGVHGGRLILGNTPPSVVATRLGGTVFDMEIADVDSDGDPDAVLIGQDGVLVVARNHVDGQLLEEEVVVQEEGGGVSGGFSPGTGSAVSVADFDGDGDLDIVSCLTQTGNGLGAIYLYDNIDDNLNFERRVVVPSGRGFEAGEVFLDIRPFIQCYDLEAGDMDGDGDVDLVATLTDDDNSNGYLVFLENNGNGNFTATSLASNLQGQARAELGDFDNDGNIDILVVAEARKVIWVYYNNGGGDFMATVVDGAAEESFNVAVGDIERDGFLDFVAVGEMGVVAYQNKGGAQGFSEPFRFQRDTRYAPPASLNYRMVQIFDADGDGRNDVLFASTNLLDVSAVFQVEPSMFGEVQQIADSAAPYSFLMGDVTGDSIPDLIYTHSGDDKTYLLVGSEVEPTPEPLPPPPAVAPVSAAAPISTPSTVPVENSGVPLQTNYAAISAIAAFLALTTNTLLCPH